MVDGSHYPLLDSLQQALREEQAFSVSSQTALTEKAAAALSLIEQATGDAEKHRMRLQSLFDETRERLLVLDEKLAADTNLVQRASKTEQELREAQASIHELKARLHELLHTEELHSARIHDLEKEINARELRERKLLDRVATLEKTNSQLESSNKGSADRIARAEETTRRAQQEVTARDKKLEEAEEQRVGLDRQIDVLAAEVKTRVAKAEELQDRQELLGGELAARNGEIEKLHAQAQAKTDEMLLTLEALETAQEEVALLREQLSTSIAPEMLATIQQSLDAERARASSFEEQLQDELARGTKSQLAQQLAETLKESEDMRAELRVLRAQFEYGAVTAPTDGAGGPEPGEAPAAAVRPVPIDSPVALREESSMMVPPGIDTSERVAPRLIPLSAPAAPAAKVKATSASEMRLLVEPLSQTVPTDGAKLPPWEEETRVRAAAESLPPHKRELGILLVTAGIVTEANIKLAAEEQRRNPHAHMSGLLVERGWATPQAVAQALACQCGVPYFHFDGHAVDPLAANLITERVALQHCCIPLSVSDDQIAVAMVNPLNLMAIESIERLTERKVNPVVSTPEEIKAAIKKNFGNNGVKVYSTGK